MYQADVKQPGLTGVSQTGFEANAHELPPAFIEWQMSARREAYARIAGGKHPTRFGAHLPVAVTLNREGEFPIHTATKGTGFIPRAGYLERYIALFDDCLARCQGRPWKETLSERVAVARRFYEHPDHIDFRCLGLLEIFQGQTYRNLLANPCLSLHYTGDGPEYPSFQVNALAEVVGPEDKRFQFIYLARQLFEHDRFHIHQPNYPFGYVAWVQEVFDKSPFHGRAGRRIETWEQGRQEDQGRQAKSKIQIPKSEIKEILIPLDNSRYADTCINLALSLAEKTGARLTGSHVYAAKLHDDRFQQMEAGLPPQYQEPQELERQRRIHDSLITRGLQLISDSYLEVLAERCHAARIEFIGKRPEGKNYAMLVADINQSRYDLVVMGARGLGAEGEGSGGAGGITQNPKSRIQNLLGSVTERVARRSKADLLVVKSEAPLDGKIVVAVDGSAQSFAGVRLAVALARVTGAAVEAVAAFDPHFHSIAFRRLEGILSEEAGRVFRFKEQEKLHNEIIDQGIAKIYRDHLETARRLAADDGAGIESTLLEGKPYPAILAHLEKVRPSLLVVGRLGVHADEGLDLGATAENLLRLAPCHVLLVARTFDPLSGKRDRILKAMTEGVPWTAEALERLEHVPPFARSFARKAIDDYARQRGLTEVTPVVMAEARERIGM
ncbi:MAG: universal stress protein [Anaerolineae bacterium]